MPNPNEFSTDPNANLFIGGVNVAEQCLGANLNNAIRYLAATIRVQFDNTPNPANFVAKTGGAFTGNPIFAGRGGYLYHNDAANTGGRIFTQAAGGSAPAGMAVGDLLFELEP